jgi:hypothetical protein
VPVYLPIVADGLNPSLRLPGAAVMGETVVHNPGHEVTLTGTYGLQNDLVETITATGGAVAPNTARQIEATTTTAVGSYAVARSQRALRWRAGTSLSWSAACAFPVAGVALSTQRVGNVSQSSATFVGYEGTVFGFHRQYAGGGEIQKLTLSASAVGAENATVTLDGTAYVVPLTAGSTTHNAAEIAAYTGWSAEWDAFQVDDSVYFLAANSGVRSGAFTFSSASAAGTFVQFDPGQDNLVESFGQAEWNQDTCDGSNDAGNPSGFLLDPSKLNIYRCVYTWEIAAFYVYNPLKLNWILAHIHTGLNSNVEQLVVDPTMQLGVAVASLGSTTALQVLCSWVGGEADSDYTPDRNPRGASSSKTGLASGTVHPLLSVRNGPVLDGHINQATIEPYILTIYNASSKDAIVTLRLNAVLTGAQYASEDVDSCANVDTTATSLANGTAVAVFVVPGGTSDDYDLTNLQIVLDREEILTAEIFVSSGAAYDATASMTWRERV